VPCLNVHCHHTGLNFQGSVMMCYERGGASKQRNTYIYICIYIYILSLTLPGDAWPKGTYKCKNILELSETVSDDSLGICGKSHSLQHTITTTGNLYRCPNCRTVASERQPYTHYTRIGHSGNVCLFKYLSYRFSPPLSAVVSAK